MWYIGRYISFFDTTKILYSIVVSNNKSDWIIWEYSHKLDALQNVGFVAYAYYVRKSSQNMLSNIGKPNKHTRQIFEEVTSNVLQYISLYNVFFPESYGN